MTRIRPITTTALSLGAVILATSVLQSEPAEARRGGAHSRMAKSHGNRPVHGRLAPYHLKSTKSLTSGGMTAGVGNVPNSLPLNPNGAQATTGAGNLPHTPPINPGGGPPTNLGNAPKSVPFDPASGPTPVPVPTSPKGGQTTTGPGNLPHTPPINPGGGPPTNPAGGPYTTPFDPTGGPTPIPVPTSPNGGQSTGGLNQPGSAPFNPNGGWHNAPGSGPQKRVGAYAESGPDGSHPCWWLKRKYDQTGNVDWFNRYTQCLAWQYSD